MKKTKSILLIVLVIMTYSCKAQQIPRSEYETNIIGTWVWEEDTNNKLVFAANGICKIYEGNELVTIYQYSFENNVCFNYDEEDVVYLRWQEVGDVEPSCLEISGMTANTLTLMIVDRAKLLYYIRQ